MGHDLPGSRYLDLHVDHVDDYDDDYGDDGDDDDDDGDDDDIFLSAGRLSLGAISLGCFHAAHPHEQEGFHHISSTSFHIGVGL